MGGRQVDDAGILYTSVRKVNGLNVVAYRPGLIQDVVQSDHFEISVTAGDRIINVKTLSFLVVISNRVRRGGPA